MTSNPLKEKLASYRILLASGSPRRQQFFKDLGIDFEIVLKPVKEDYPKGLKGREIAQYLAQLKATVFKNSLRKNDILITADTIVWFQDRFLAKPENTAEAREILQQLSGNWHEVITAVCFTTLTKSVPVSCTTQVKFKDLSEEEIRFYLEMYEPFDKAGAYGIQEWLGYIGIEEIRGSYTNVVGLPTHLVYKTLMDMAG